MNMRKKLLLLADWIDLVYPTQKRQISAQLPCTGTKIDDDLRRFASRLTYYYIAMFLAGMASMAIIIFVLAVLCAAGACK